MGEHILAELCRFWPSRAKFSSDLCQVFVELGSFGRVVLSFDRVVSNCGRNLAKNWPKTRQSGQNWPKTGQKLAKNWQKAGQNWPKTCQKLAKNYPKLAKN
jgi:hypothetical protein